MQGGNKTRGKKKEVYKLGVGGARVREMDS